MSVRVLSADLRILNMHTRMPFKYGIATLTALPHLVVCLEMEIDGKKAHGYAADGLPPKWFTKDPKTSFEDDLRDMFSVIRHACEIAGAIQEADTVFDLWQQVYTMQMRWADRQPKPLPPLLWAFGVSLVERAAIDAFCRATGSTFAIALRSEALGTRLGDLHEELDEHAPWDYLPAPLRRIIARHTIGLADPITDGDIPLHERVDDGLPQSLEACIKAHGLTHFKIKLCGDAERDIARLTQLAAVIGAHCKAFAFTLDGNEFYRSIAPFRELWVRLAREPSLEGFMRGLLFVEQPLHRDVALSEAVGKAMHVWRDRPPIIIDESDGLIESAATALSLGYRGTSFKNCKGVFKGIANACLMRARSEANPQTPCIMSGEDLANVGPIAVLQDACVAANLGITHVERNGHHYFRGLSMWPGAVQQATLRAHGDAYRQHERGYPTLNIRGGAIEIGSVIDAPFGVGIEADASSLIAIDDWRIEMLSE